MRANKAKLPLAIKIIPKVEIGDSSFSSSSSFASSDVPVKILPISSTPANIPAPYLPSLNSGTMVRT